MSRLINITNSSKNIFRPTFVFPHKKLNSKPVVFDTITDQLEELFLISNPQYRFNKNYKIDYKKLPKNFSWVYYPWLNYLVHCLDEKNLLKLKTVRNQFLITAEEQQKFYNARIGILGLSVGSHVALTLTMTGGGKNLKLADPDIISVSNLNRIRSPLHVIGINKAIAVARQVYEMNPYAKIEVFDRGLSEKNMEKFLLKPKIDVLIEEMDNPYLKIRVREVAKKNKIPVIMAADNVDGNIIDIERYDLKSDYPILHGFLKDKSAADLKNVDPKELPKIIAGIVGAKLSSPRMLESVMAVGKTIYSWPQLGTAANLCGSTLAYLARKIILGEKIKDGRIDFSVDRLLGVFPKNYNREKKRLLKKLFSN